MPFENEKPSCDRLIEELRSLRGALNAKTFGDDNPVLIEIATLKTQVQHLQGSIRDLRMCLWGIAAGVFGLIIKMVIEASLTK
jgi:hypothetical protein